jgi:hypothetical protein
VNVVIFINLRSTRIHFSFINNRIRLINFILDLVNLRDHLQNHIVFLNEWLFKLPQPLHLDEISFQKNWLALLRNLILKLLISLFFKMVNLSIL